MGGGSRGATADTARSLPAQRHRVRAAALLPHPRPRSRPRCRGPASRGRAALRGGTRRQQGPDGAGGTVPPPSQSTAAPCGGARGSGNGERAAGRGRARRRRPRRAPGSRRQRRGHVRCRAPPRRPGAARPGGDVSGWGRSPPADWAAAAARGGGRPMGALLAGARAVICAPGRGAERPRCCRRRDARARRGAEPSPVAGRAPPGPSPAGSCAGAAACGGRPGGAGPFSRGSSPPRGAVRPRAAPRSGRDVGGAWRRGAGTGGAAPRFSCAEQTLPPAAAADPRAEKRATRPRPVLLAGPSSGGCRLAWRRAHAR